MAILVSPGVSVTICDIHEYIPPVIYYHIIDDARVDGAVWYSIRISLDVYNWLNTQDAELWSVASASQGVYDVHEELLFIMKLMFPV